MRKYLIERSMPGIGRSTPNELRALAETSNEALARLAPDIQWVNGFVTDDVVFCLFLARDEELVRRHAALSGFPLTRILEVRAVTDPTTATAPVLEALSSGRSAR